MTSRFSGKDKSPRVKPKTDMARLLVSENRVTLESKTGIFIVNGVQEAVTLDKQQCSCRTRACGHLEAAAISTRIYESKPSRIMSLSELIRKIRGKGKVGKKGLYLVKNFLSFQLQIPT